MQIKKNKRIALEYTNRVASSSSAVRARGAGVPWHQKAIGHIQQNITGLLQQTKL